MVVYALVIVTDSFFVHYKQQLYIYIYIINGAAGRNVHVGLVER